MQINWEESNNKKLSNTKSSARSGITSSIVILEHPLVGDIWHAHNRRHGSKVIVFVLPVVPNLYLAIGKSVEFVFGEDDLHIDKLIAFHRQGPRGENRLVVVIIIVIVVDVVDVNVVVVVAVR